VNSVDQLPKRDIPKGVRGIFSPDVVTQPCPFKLLYHCICVPSVRVDSANELESGSLWNRLPINQSVNHHLLDAADRTCRVRLVKEHDSQWNPSLCILISQLHSFDHPLLDEAVGHSAMHLEDDHVLDVFLGAANQVAKVLDHPCFSASSLSHAHNWNPGLEPHVDRQQLLHIVRGELVAGVRVEKGAIWALISLLSTKNAAEQAELLLLAKVVKVCVEHWYWVASTLNPQQLIEVFCHDLLLQDL